MALRNLLVRIGADLSGLQKGFKQAQNQMNDFKNKIGGIKGKIAGALAGLGTGMVIKNATEDAIKFEAMMGTLSESLGSSMNDFVKWQNTVGRSLGFSKLQSADLANTLSLNFKAIATSQKDLVDKTTKMMETAALIANKRGMAMSEVSDRIRSAMNQEADGADELGVNVRVSAIQQSEAYKQMANGTPWADLSSNMQKAILYHHILQSVSMNLGDTLQNNTAMKMAVFTATLNDTKLALGQAFLPILNVVLPVLTAFMGKIETALSYVAAFSRALFGGKSSSAGGLKKQTKATQQQAVAIGGLGDATEKAGKQAKKAGKDAKRGVAGFDEVNTLADPSSSADGGGGGSSGGGGSGGGLGGITQGGEEADGLFDKLNKKARDLANKIKEFFKNSSGWQALKDGVKGFWQSLKDLWNSPAIKNFRKAFVEDLPDFFNDLMLIGGGVFKVLAGVIDEFNSLLNSDFKKAMEGAGKIVAGLYDIITGTIGLVFPDLGKAMEEFGKKFGEKWKWFQDEFVKGSNSVTDVAKKVGTAILLEISKKIVELAGKMANKWIEIKSDATKKFEEIKSNIVSKFTELSNSIKTKATDAWNNFKAPFSGAYSWFKTNVIDRISSAFSSIKDAFSGSITNGFKKVYNTAVGWLNDMIRSINKIKIPGIWNGVNISTIPALAKGGITNGPTLALIGDNPGGQEVVSPLDKLQGIVGNAVMAAMKFSQSNGGNNLGGDIILNIDGRQFARIVKPFIDKETKRVGKDVKLNPI